MTLNSSWSGQFYKSEEGSNAVTCMKEFYSGEYFVVGFSSGTVAIYNVSNSEAINGNYTYCLCRSN
jgi:hypothetical protein